MEEDEQSRLEKKKQKDNENEKLWQQLEIDFQLDAFKFPDNKIYGIININPESSRELIKQLFLVINRTNRIKFDPHYTHLCASSFNTNRKNPSAYIEAVPIDSISVQEKKTSKICYFFFTGVVFSLSPTISFDWSGDKAKLVVNWYHIGDKYAHKYILYLDDVEIQYIRQRIIDDAFDVQIEGFKAEEKHTFQIAARLNNGKETYRSELMEFIVPSKELNEEGKNEFIIITDEPAPANLPALMPTKEDKTQEDFHPNEQEKTSNLNTQKKEVVKNVHPNKQEKTSNPNTKKEEAKPSHPIEHKGKGKKDPNHISRPKLYACCNQRPHKTFPGIEHYFKNIRKKSFSSEAEEDDDDDDVVISNN